MPTPRKERIASNEVAFRAFNEELATRRGLDERPADDLVGFVCECGDEDCEVFVQVPLEVYRRVRSDDRTFLVVRGHDIGGVEDVVEEGEQHAVVRKHPDVDPVVER